MDEGSRRSHTTAGEFMGLCRRDDPARRHTGRLDRGRLAQRAGRRDTGRCRDGDRRQRRIHLLRTADGVRRFHPAAAMAAGVGGAAIRGDGVPRRGSAFRRSCARARYIAARSASGTLAPAPRLSRSVREGFVTNLLNPSLATYYLLIVPEFIPRGAPFAASAMTLTAIHVGAGDLVAPDLGGGRRHACGVRSPGRGRGARSRRSAGLRYSRWR